MNDGNDGYGCGITPLLLCLSMPLLALIVNFSSPSSEIEPEPPAQVSTLSASFLGEIFTMTDSVVPRRMRYLFSPAWDDSKYPLWRDITYHQHHRRQIQKFGGCQVPTSASLDEKGPNRRGNLLRMFSILIACTVLLSFSLGALLWSTFSKTSRQRLWRSVGCG